MVTSDRKTETRYEDWMVNTRKFASKLRTSDEAGVLKEQTKSIPKICDCGVTCMFVGYNKNYRDNLYRVWNPDTNIIHNTHGIIWLRMMSYQDKLTTEMVADVMQFDDSKCQR